MSHRSNGMCTRQYSTKVVRSNPSTSAKNPPLPRYDQKPYRKNEPLIA